MDPVLILLPANGFDPSEAAVPWQALRAKGIEVVFATPHGQPASADPLMVTGEGLDPWGQIRWLSRLKLVGLFLRANQQARLAYAAMTQDANFLHPIPYAAVSADHYAGLLLPGGHAKTMKVYLESEEVQSITRAFLLGPDEQALQRPVAAICHGVLVLARTKTASGESVLKGRKVTALTWPLEKKAWQTARISRYWEPLYYRTYPENPNEPEGYRSTEAEIKRALASPEDFLSVPASIPHFRQKTDGLHRDTPTDAGPAWVVQDGNLITARWPGDVNTFAEKFISALTMPSNTPHKKPEKS